LIIIKLKKREANNEEIEEYYNREKELKLKDIINFINKVKYVENKNHQIYQIKY